MHRILSVALALVAATADVGSAQRYGSVMEDEKIRVRYCRMAVQPEDLESGNCGRAEGTVVEANADTVVVGQRTGDSLAIPFAVVTKLEVSHGYRSRVLAGIAIGGGLAAIAIADSDRCSHPDDAAGCALFGVMAMGGKLSCRAQAMMLLWWQSAVTLL